MRDHPRVSFIVLSYNYAAYIPQTLRSILDQTYSDCEIVVIDDASSDRSCEAVQSFVDPRIRLYVNEQNIGGAASYNRAVGLCRGEYLVNVDADDWIAPRKTELQLQALERDSSLDILGTYVSYVDVQGQRHRQSSKYEAWTNCSLDLNLVSSWIPTNYLCRSSTMMRRSVHERVGLDDTSMVRAPDYELWTRALSNGCRFGIVEEPLTFYRFHDNSVTYGDPHGTFLEICYLMQKNLVPLIEKLAAFDCFMKIMDWIVSHEQFAACEPGERYRLLGAMIASRITDNFAAFRETVVRNAGDSTLASIGRRLLVPLILHPAKRYAEKLDRDVEKYIEARDFWHTQSDKWERTCDYWHAQSDNWQREYMKVAAVGADLGFKDLVRLVFRWARSRKMRWKTRDKDA